jgi:hypothetical protein
MLFSQIKKGLFLLAVAALMLAASACQQQQSVQPTPSNTLLDRAQIEDLLVDYYGQLGGNGRDFGDFYAEDGILDVNGIIAQGQKAIEDLYKRSAEESALPAGTFRMLLTNLKIVVNGETATADVIWTGVNSKTVQSTPEFVEQGREHDELVKINERWLFKRRVITSDGGLPPMYEKTYIKR